MSIIKDLKQIMTLNLRANYNNLAFQTMDYYRSYQAAASGLSTDAVVEYYWFTIKPTSPAGSWERFQTDYVKLVSAFHSSVCRHTVGTRFNSANKKHLKPFIFAAPDYENSNESPPQRNNSFNHVHGLIMLQGEQITYFKDLIDKNGNDYQYTKEISQIRSVTLNEITSNDRDLYNYINYINKNTSRRSLNINPNMMLPNDKAFKAYLNEHMKPHQDGSRLKKAA